MIRSYLSRRALWPARVPDPDAPPRLALLWREAGSLLRALGGRVRPMPPEPNPDSAHPPVMVLPGFLSGDWSTKALRADLRRAGFRCYAWGLGFNRGATADIIDRINARVEWIIARTGQPPALVGWSLGGVMAREIAKLHPEKVSKIITMGSPFSGSPRANNGWRAYQAIAGHRVDEPEFDAIPAEKPPVETIALWSPRDGVVSPRSACGRPGERDRTVCLRCTHMGFVNTPEAIEAVLRELDAR